MKRLDAANDNDTGKQIARTRQVWQPRIGRDLTDEDARQIMHNVTGFFGVLAEWARAEKWPLPPTTPRLDRKKARCAMTAEIHRQGAWRAPRGRNMDGTLPGA